MEEKLKDKHYKEIILNKMKGASQRGANERLNIMFEVLNLSIGKIERKAIKARNRMAHSSMGEADDNEIIETIKLTRAYETLFHSLFLKALGYTGNYIDYYSDGFPERSITTNIPE